ncbi:hypothetical protein D3C81_1471220 [compost metagenome]
MVAAHAALVGHARQAAGAGQHAEQRHFGQADRGGAVIHQQDFIASQRQFVAAAGGGAVAGGDELDAGMAAGVLDAVACLVGELAEVHLPGVAGLAEHEDIGARAENALAGAGQHHGAHFGMLEADALQGVVQFDIDAKIVGIQLQRVAGPQTAFLVHVHGQRGDGTVKGQQPVAILGRMARKGNRGRDRHGACLLDAL